MRISNEFSTESVALSKVTIEYTQDLDSCQLESEVGECCQVLTIETDDAGGGKFMRFSTNSWSIDKLEDLVDVFEDFKKRSSCD